MRFVRNTEEFPPPMVTEVHLLNSMREFQHHPTSTHPFLWNRVGETWGPSQYAHSWFALANAYTKSNMIPEAERCQQIGEALERGDWFESN